MPHDGARHSTGLEQQFGSLGEWVPPYLRCEARGTSCKRHPGSAKGVSHTRRQLRSWYQTSGQPTSLPGTCGMPSWREPHGCTTLNGNPADLRREQ